MLSENEHSGIVCANVRVAAQFRTLNSFQILLFYLKD